MICILLLQPRKNVLFIEIYQPFCYWNRKKNRVNQISSVAPLSHRVARAAAVVLLINSD